MGMQGQGQGTQQRPESGRQMLEGGKASVHYAACRNQVMDIYADLPHLTFGSHSTCVGVMGYSNPSPSLNVAAQD